MNNDKLIEFAKEQCKIFPEDSYMGKYLRETLKMLQAEPCGDAISREDMYFKLTNGAYPNETIEQFIDRLVKELEDMPPVTPTQRWIPVSERLPKPYEYVNCTCHSLIDDREDWVVETMYLPIPKEVNVQSYSDWGNIPILNWGKAEVIAWMHRDIPEPYKAERGSEEV